MKRLMQRYLRARRQHNGGGVEGNLLNRSTVIVLQQTLATAFPDNNDIIGTTYVGKEDFSRRIHLQWSNRWKLTGGKARAISTVRQTIDRVLMTYKQKNMTMIKAKKTNLKENR